MTIPLEVSTRGIPLSDAIDAKIRQRVAGLERRSKHMLRCEVWIEAAHRGHHRKGPAYGVRVRLIVPREELIVESQPAQEDVYVAIRQAFDAARRQLQDYERRWPGQERGHRLGRRQPRARATETASGSSPFDSEPVGSGAGA